MPRRNNRRRFRRRELPDELLPPPTFEQMARSLVARKLASPNILDWPTHRYPPSDAKSDSALTA